MRPIRNLFSPLPTPSHRFTETVVGTNKTHTFEITNSGETPAANIQIETGHATLSTSSCSSFPCNLEVTYAPNSSSDDLSNTPITISYENGVNSSSLVLSISATAISQTLLSSNPTSHNFGNLAVGASQTKSFQINNSGQHAPTNFQVQTPSGVSANTCSSFPCNFEVTYAPGDASQDLNNDLVTISYNNGATTASLEITLNGQAQTPALLSSTETSFNFNNVVVGNSPSHTFTLSKTGEAPFTDPKFTNDFNDLSWLERTLVCNANSCTIKVDYSPTDPAHNIPENTRVLFSYHDGANTQTLSFGIQGLAISRSTLASSPSSHDFGNVFVGLAPSMNFNLTNSGEHNPDLTVTHNFGPGLTLDSCNALPCELVVTYEPENNTQDIAPRTQITVTYNDGFENQELLIPVSGLAITRADLSLSSLTHDFGNKIVEGTSIDHTISLTNSGDSAPQNLQVIASGGITVTTCAPAPTCDLTITYAPESSSDDLSNARVSISYNDGIEEQSLTFTVLGQAISRSNIVASTTSHDFGSVVAGTSVEKEITFTNNGEHPPENFSVTPHLQRGITASTCTNISCTLTLTYNPTDASQDLSSSYLTVSYNNGVEVSSFNITIEGEAISPSNLASTPNTHNFGDVVINTSRNQSFELSNDGQHPISSLVVTTTLNNTPWFRVDGCTSLPCTITVTYSPTDTDDHRIPSNTQVSVTYNNGVGDVVLPISISGQAISPSKLLSDNSSHNFGDVVIGAPPQTHTFGLTSIGQTPITELNITDSFGGVDWLKRTSSCTAIPCDLEITYDPKNTSHDIQDASITISFNDGATTSEINLPISGNAITKTNLAAAPTSLDFENVVIGAPVIKTLTLSNSGERFPDPLTITNNAGLSTTLNYDCASLPCTLSLRYHPNATSEDLEDDAKISISYGDGLTTKEIQIPISGEALTRSLLTTTTPSHSFQIQLPEPTKHIFLKSRTLGRPPPQAFKLKQVMRPSPLLLVLLSLVT